MSFKTISVELAALGPFQRDIVIYLHAILGNSQVFGFKGMARSGPEAAAWSALWYQHALIVQASSANC